MKLVQIMRGLPGSGKSHYTKSKNARVVSADTYFMRTGEYRFDPTKLRDAHNACLNAYMEALRKGEPYIIVDNTNLTVWEIATYYRLAELNGYQVAVVEMTTDLNVCLKRNTHNVPEMKMAMMYQTLKYERLPSHWRVEYIDGDL